MAGALALVLCLLSLLSYTSISPTSTSFFRISVMRKLGNSSWNSTTQTTTQKPMYFRYVFTLHCVPARLFPPFVRSFKIGRNVEPCPNSARTPCRRTLIPEPRERNLCGHSVIMARISTSRTSSLRWMSPSRNFVSKLYSHGRVTLSTNMCALSSHFLSPPPSANVLDLNACR